MFYVLNIKKILALAGGGLAVFALLLCLRPEATAPASSSQLLPAARAVLIIDPGHGGEDGGAVAEDGTAEAGINLSIALRLRDLMDLLGWDTAMTREEDISVYTEGASTLREKKVSDLQNRVAMINGYEDAVLLSIHQNSLPQAKSVRGAQAFYNTAEGAEQMAAAIQETLNLAANGETPKAHKAIDSSVYLMKHIDCAGVLIECGLLSNGEDLARLQEDAYQKALVTAIAAGFLQNYSLN